MITIIEKHEKIKPEYKMTCRECGSIFTFNDEDIKGSGTQWDWFYYINCPVCNIRYTDISEKNLIRNLGITVLR